MSHDPLPDFPVCSFPDRLQPRPIEESSFLERSGSALFSPLSPFLSSSPISLPLQALLSPFIFSPDTIISDIFLLSRQKG